MVCTLIHIFFLEKPDHAEILGLWQISSDKKGSQLFSKGKMVPVQGKTDLLTEFESTSFLAESFTFGFFVSIDNSYVELHPGEKLDSPYQSILVVPGAYDIAVDPSHENLRIHFTSFNSEPYEVVIPTLQVRRWHQFVISIEGRTADIYQNGILLKSVSLPNVISGRPGTPYAFMNGDTTARLAYLQAWPRRLKEIEVINNYRWNSDGQGIPPIPSTVSSFPFDIFNMNFCVGTFCLESTKPKSGGLTYIDYSYA